jgi:hypothetical protein
MGRGLFRLYLALWLMWLSAGVVYGHKEIATYIGFEKWTIEGASERSKEKCKKDPDSIWCYAIPSDDYVSQKEVNDVVSIFNLLMIKAPFYLLLFLTAMYWLVKWVVAGFRRKH